MKCIGPTAKDADLWTLIWEDVHTMHHEGILLEVEHVNGREGGYGKSWCAASTVQQGKVEVYAALQHTASFHCLVEE